MLNGIGRYAVTASRKGERSIQVRANANFTANPNNTSTTSASISGDYLKPLLDGFLPVDRNGNTPEQSEHTMRALYRDIYAFDAISGSAVDLMAELPFSDFTLSGLPDQEMLRKFGRSLEAISAKTLLPELTRDYLVTGSFLGVANMDDQTKTLTSIMPQDLDNVNMMAMPIYGQDPIFDIKIPQNILVLLNSRDPRVIEQIEKYGDDWKEIAKKKMYSLDPRKTIYIPRRTFSTNFTGTSYYRRVLPMWLIEKAVTRGTIDLAYRRQKSILHLICGDGDSWEPDNNQLAEIVNMFIQADRDPTGAIIATRPDIQTSEIRDPTSFWRADELFDSLANMKYKALGISESFLDSTTTISNMENALSMFLEQSKAYRDLTTRKLFYQRLFPLIAMENNYKITNEKQVVTASALDAMEMTYAVTSNAKITMLGNIEFDASKYYIPKLQWHKSLKPEADSEYLSILATLEEKGVPIPLRMWAAAGGQSLQDIMGGFEDDIKLKTLVNKYKEKLPKAPLDEAASMFSGASLSSSKKNRNFDNTPPLRDADTKKVLSAKGRKFENEKTNKKMAEALSNMAKKTNFETKIEGSERAKQRIYHYSKGSKIFGTLE